MAQRRDGPASDSVDPNDCHRPLKCQAGRESGQRTVMLSKGGCFRASNAGYKAAFSLDSGG
ncbi:MAG: hypothetical protein CBB71_11030 [Rhodopirellula sp. TMED11]|nr:MAG: hypothetical protein CBB71_11030 [Rhodopirellula sp. TMED11]